MSFACTIYDYVDRCPRCIIAMDNIRMAALLPAALAKLPSHSGTKTLTYTPVPYNNRNLPTKKKG